MYICPGPVGVCGLQDIEHLHLMEQLISCKLPPAMLKAASTNGMWGSEQSK